MSAGSSLSRMFRIDVIRMKSYSLPNHRSDQRPGFFWGLLMLLWLGGCASVPPSQPSNLCALFEEKDDWYEASIAAQKTWGIPVPVQMAIMKQESAFVADARPPRKWFLGFIPLSRPSSAYGYSQALDGTWDRYRESTGHTGAERDDFADSADFIGWYARMSQTELGISTTDAYRQYLAYHEGQGGYARGSYLKKPWLQDVARKVAGTADRYERQLDGCKPDLDEELASN